MEMSMLNHEYVAGLFDGEGTIRIAKWEKPNSPHIRYCLYGGIGMCHLPIIKLLQETYGGSFNENRHDKRNPRARIQFLWIVSSQKAASFLRHIQPYAIVKLDQIDLALEFQKHMDANPYRQAGRGHLRDNHQELIDIREKFYQQMTLLKQESFPSQKELAGKQPRQFVDLTCEDSLKESV
jgi:hypothetical protein